MVEITPITILIGLAINGIATGIGSAIGNYVANQHIIKTIENVGSKLKGDKVKEFGKNLGEIVKQEIKI